MQLPREYMSLSLTDLVALYAPGASRSDGVDVQLVHEAIDALADRIERQRAAMAADQTEWLAQQIEGLTTTVGEPGGAP